LRHLGVRSLLVFAAAAVLALGAGAATARSADPQLLDVSKQVAEMNKKLTKLLAKGKTVKATKTELFATCGTLPPSSQVFWPWRDLAWYSLAPQGDFAQTTQWSLSAGATVVNEHDLWTPGTKALKLGPNAAAASPVTCVSVENPTIRFFAKNTGPATSTLGVSVMYTDVKGKLQTLKVAQLKASSTWGPTIVVPLYVNALAVASPEGVTPVSIKFTAEGLTSGAWTISSLYVDPFVSR
jgi:hypothetical protein